MEDVNTLNEIIDMLKVENNDNLAIPILYYKSHLLINIDYFSGSDMFKFLTDKLFETCPQYHCSYHSNIYVYIGDIRNWLKEYLEKGEKHGREKNLYRR